MKMKIPDDPKPSRPAQRLTMTTCPHCGKKISTRGLRGHIAFGGCDKDRSTTVDPVEDLGPPRLTVEGGHNESPAQTGFREKFLAFWFDND